MADVLDHLQKQEDLLNRLHIQAARQLIIRVGAAAFVLLPVAPSTDTAGLLLVTCIREEVLTA